MKGSQGYKNYKLTTRNLTDFELQKRLDLYSKGGKEQFFKIQKIKKRYQDEVESNQSKRSKSDIFFAQGIRAGLPHSPYDNIKYSREEADQGLRDQTVEEAKTEYRRHQNLSRWFGASDGKPKEAELQKPGRKYLSKNRKNLSEYFSKTGSLPEKLIKSKEVDRARD